MSLDFPTELADIAARRAQLQRAAEEAARTQQRLRDALIALDGEEQAVRRLQAKAKQQAPLIKPVPYAMPGTGTMPCDATEAAHGQA